MAGRVGRSRPEGWRRPALAAASVGAHLIVLGVLALRAAGPPAPHLTAPVILVDIAPRAPIRDERPRPPSTPDDLRSPTLDAPSPQAAAAPRFREPDEEDTPPGSETTGVSDAWRVGGHTADAGWAAIPGAGGPASPGRLGCRFRNRLTPEQQALCDQAFGQAAGGAAPIAGTGDARRDARLAQEGARALARYEAQRAPLAGGAGVMGPADCAGSNFGTGCAGAHLGGVPGVDMNQGAATNIRQRSNKLD